MMDLYGHPFSSYTWKVLIVFYENEIPFNFKIIDPDHPKHAEQLSAISPQGKFPALLNGETAMFEASIIIEYLQKNYELNERLIPKDPSLALDVRMLDRFFDNYVMTPVQTLVEHRMRKDKDVDALSVKNAHATLQKSYAWLDQRLASHPYACGHGFTLADCAAAPSLFYAHWVSEIEQKFTNLKDYRARLLMRPAVQRCIEEARPYRPFFPGGAPDQD